MDIFVACPHCGGAVVVAANQVNCAVFRHGEFKGTATQLPPHASKAECDAWVEAGAVLGCAKPFQLVRRADGTWAAQTCAYI